MPWHDTDWTGRVCASPRKNLSCAVLRRIKQQKDPDAESEVAERSFDEVSDQLPPCVLERVGFMRSKRMTVQRNHAYARNEAYAHFAETTQRMAPYSLEVIPFRWMRIDGYERASKPWGITVDLGLEQGINRRLPFESEYMQDHRNQLALLDSFFSALRPKRRSSCSTSRTCRSSSSPSPGPGI